MGEAVIFLSRGMSGSERLDFGPLRPRVWNPAGVPTIPTVMRTCIALHISLRMNPDVHGLRLGPLVETVSLYADDMILYLADSGPSLQTAL